MMGVAFTLNADDSRSFLPGSGLSTQRLALYALIALAFVSWPALTASAAASPASADWPWWATPLALFALTSVLGVLAALAGIGGSVLFVPIVSGFAPFIHLDFVRATGLLVALSGALSAGPGLIRRNLVNLRLAIPIAVMASMGAILEAVIGLALPVRIIQLALGGAILFIVAVMLLVRPTSGGETGPKGFIARALKIEGRYFDKEQEREVIWYPKGMEAGLVLFFGVGVMAGMFGLGAGWANIPVLNLVMGVPLRIAVATSYFLLAITDTTAALIYFHRGALLPLITVPSILGIMLGARLGSFLLVIAPTRVIRRVVIAVLLVAGTRALLRGLGI